jgi:hypothetical protein
VKLLSLTLVKGDDWEGVYDQYGHLVEEGHSIDWPRLLQKNACMVVGTKYADLDWLEGVGSFPYKLSEVVLSEV